MGYPFTQVDEGTGAVKFTWFETIWQDKFTERWEITEHQAEYDEVADDQDGGGAAEGDGGGATHDRKPERLKPAPCPKP
eukprot:2378018-Pyramimonas_sp.AAC.1